MFRLLLISMISISFFGAPASALEVRIINDKVSIHAKNVPLQDILKRLASQGVKVQVDPRINPPITASFEGRDIRRGLESILRSLNFVLLWESVEGTRGPGVRLSEIQIFEPGKKEAMRPLAPSFVLPVLRNPVDGSLYVKDEILLGLGSRSLKDLHELLKRIGGRILEGSAAAGVYRIQVPEGSDLSAILDQARDAGFEWSEPNYAFPMPAPERVVLEAVAGPKQADAKPARGAVPVAVLDSGMSMDAAGKWLIPTYFDAMNPGSSMEDPVGHGTQMVLVASGVVKPIGARDDLDAVQVIPIRIFDDNGYTSNFHVMKSIDFALSNGARVVSMSWGSETNSRFLEQAMSDAVSKGLIIVASAGNKPTGEPFYPAAYESVIGVGALAPDGMPWKDSNYGVSATIYAPGFAGMPVGYQGEPGIYAGTSISAAYTAKLISGILARDPKASVTEILKELKSTKP